MRTEQALYVLALICFVVAALPHHVNLKFEWIGVALLVATRL